VFGNVTAMNTITKTLLTIEHHCLLQPYSPLRLHKQGLLEKLVISIEAHGQLMPVVVVPLSSNRWILMDGYLRLKALRRLGKDTISAEIWACDPARALLALLTGHQSRAWEAIEEALLLQELHAQHGLSQGNIANKIGRDKSWVSRRLSLLEQMPESIQQAIMTGKLSLWIATRLIVPLARANTSHAECLLQYLLKHSLSTRELQFFYDHYQQSNHPQRSQMANDPDLFFKAQKLLLIEKQTKALQAGPVGQWQSKLHLVRNALAPLNKLASNVFIPRQEATERRQLLELLHSTRTQFDVLTETVRSLLDAYERHAADHHQSASKGSQPSHHQPTA
jgi:ParB family transcriptional regulator, chromosome partitioning protein